jgi:hypothetical protein
MVLIKSQEIHSKKAPVAVTYFWLSEENISGELAERNDVA